MKPRSHFSTSHETPGGEAPFLPWEPSTPCASDPIWHPTRSYPAQLRPHTHAYSARIPLSRQQLWSGQISAQMSAQLQLILAHTPARLPHLPHPLPKNHHTLIYWVSNNTQATCEVACWFLWGTFRGRLLYSLFSLSEIGSPLTIHALGKSSVHL